MVNIP